MDKACNELIKSMIQVLDDIQSNKSFSPLNIEGVSNDVVVLASKINLLGQNIEELNTFLIDLSNGKLNTESPSNTNYIASAAKQLHSNLNHLTWQTQQIANGDYRQKIEFLGDFATSFNELTKQLSEREAALESRNKILRTIFDHIECLFVFDAEKRNEALYINDFAKRTFYVGENLVFDNYEGSNFIHQLINLEVGVCTQHEIFDSFAKQWYNVIVSELYWTNNKPALLFYCINITSHKQRQFELEKNAFIDSLTGLNNRRSLDLHLSEIIHYVTRLKTYITLYIIDIDYFKKYNDKHGHLQGDAGLISTAKCLKSVFVRSSDFIARFGGEEFIIVSLNMDPTASLKYAEKLRNEIENYSIPLYNNPSEITNITVSIGLCSLIPTLGITPTSLIAMADTALYRSKKAGRNRITLAK